MRTFWFQNGEEFIPIKANNKKDAQKLFLEFNAQDVEVDIEPYELLFGLEVEAIYNKDKLNLIKGSYHDEGDVHLLNGDWICESDGSLSGYEFTRSGTCEFISIPAPYSKISEVVESFKKTITRKAKCKELKDVLAFNNSTGAHVHISLLHHTNKVNTVTFRGIDVEIEGDIINLKSFVAIEFMKKIGTALKKQIKTDLPIFYPKFISRYYRHYACRVIKTRAYTTRTQEFNYTTSYPTIEFRSSHITGINTWDYFEKYFSILTKVFNDKILKELSAPKPFISTLNIDIETEDTQETIELSQELRVLTTETENKEV